MKLEQLYNIMKALEKVILKEEIVMKNAQCACMNTTNVNSDKKRWIKTQREV